MIYAPHYRAQLSNLGSALRPFTASLRFHFTKPTSTYTPLRNKRLLSSTRAARNTNTSRASNRIRVPDCSDSFATHKMTTPDITLYTGATPNGWKISIALEELGLPYKTVAIDISKNTQKEPWFLAINPNGRIPAITDTFGPDGKPINVFESGSILQYLAEQYDKEHKISYPAGTREAYEVNNWLFFQNAGVGPMQGQANHFYRYAPEKIPYGIQRYINETRRLYQVLEDHLKKSKSGYLVGDHITIADITHYGWVSIAAWSGVDINEFPNLKAWQGRLGEREAVKKGMEVPNPSSILEKIKGPSVAGELALAKQIIQGEKKPIDAK